MQTKFITKISLKFHAYKILCMQTEFITKISLKEYSKERRKTEKFLSRADLFPSFDHDLVLFIQSISCEIYTQIALQAIAIVFKIFSLCFVESLFQVERLQIWHFPREKLLLFFSQYAFSCLSVILFYPQNQMLIYSPPQKKKDTYNVIISIYIYIYILKYVMSSL